MMSDNKKGIGKVGSNFDSAIFLVKKEEMPVIYFRFVIMSGSTHDPEEKEGLAYFTAHLMRRGTQSYSRKEIDDTLDFIASDIGINCQKDITVFSGRTLQQNLEQFYRLFSEILLKPTFPREEFEKLKIDQQDVIEAIRESDEALTREAFNNFIYQGHPYGHLNPGRIDSINALTEEDVRNFYKNRFRKGKILLGLAGAVPDSLITKVKNDFSSFSEESGKQSDPPKASVLEEKKILVVEKEGRTQTQIRIGHLLSPTRKDPDYYPLLLANNYLGKHRVSIGRLYQEVREKRGLSYGAYSYLEHFLGFSGPIKLSVPNLVRKEQYFSMWIYPKSENAKFVIKLALKEMTELVEKGLDEEHLKEIKSYTMNNFPFEVETPIRKLAMMLDDEICGSKKFAEHFEDRIESVNSEDVKKAVGKHLFPDHVAMTVLVSDGEQFVGEMLSPETDLEYPSGVNPKDFEKEDRLIKSFPLRLTEEDFRIVKASDLFK
jgi:zinc protease